MATSENANLSNAKWPDIKNRIFDFAFGAALNDATMQRAYSPTKYPGTTKKTDAQKKDDAGLKRDMKKIIADKTKTTVRRFIDNKLLKNELTSQGEFDTAFYGLANEIAGELSKGKLLTAYKELRCDNDAKEEWVGTFTFGNIQKLINMTAKYMYVTCYENQNKRDCFQYCHCPMDSVMIQTVDSAYNGEIGKDVNWREVRWSKITDDLVSSPTETIPSTSIDVYKQFQTRVKELLKDRDIYPIEYDFLYWKRDDDGTKNLCTPVPQKSPC